LIFNIMHPFSNNQSFAMFIMLIPFLSYD
jgi:hypothetical protein